MLHLAFICIDGTDNWSQTANKNTHKNANCLLELFYISKRLSFEIWPKLQ